MKKKILFVTLFTLFSFYLFAQSRSDLGAATPFTVLAKTGILNTDNAGISGKVGVYPGRVVTGLDLDLLQGVLEIGTPNASQAQQDLTRAYDHLAGRTPTGNLTGQALSGKILKPGVYRFDQDLLLSGDLILDNGGNPNGTFIFQVNGDLTLRSWAAIIFSEAAKPRIQNVFWQVKGQVSIGEGCMFLGSVLAHNNIRVQSSTQVQGRLLTKGGQVHLSGNQITLPTDLAVSMTKSPGATMEDIYFIDEPITFIIKAQNLGPIAETGVRVRSVLPPGVSYVTSKATASSYDPATATWTIPAFPNNATETLEITGKINNRAVDFVAHSASIAGNGMDEILANNSSFISSICVAPANPGTIKGSAAVCSRSSDHVFSVDPISGAQYYNWLLPGGWTIVSGHNTNVITVRAGTASGTITLTVGNVCAVSTSSKKTVTVNTPMTREPEPITTNMAQPCVGTTGITYSIPEVAGAENYLWEVPADWIITAGQGTHAITVTAGEKGGDIRVVARNGCGEKPGSKITVYPTALVPAAPASVSGDVTPCAGQTNIAYSVAEVPQALSYKWEVPEGWLITKGQGTARILVTVGRTAGNISVKAFNNCGEGPARQLAVAPSLNLAATPPAIDGSTEVCAGEQVTYSTPQVTGSLTYVWQVPADWTILAGQGSPALQVRVGKTAGQVEVKTRNGCGDSSVRAVMVAVHPGAPALPAPIAGPAQVCSGKTGLVYTTAAQPGVKSYTWQVPDGWTITAGQGTSTILVTAGTNPGPITVQAANSCGLSQVATLPVTPTRPLPATLGPIISSTAVICQNQQQVSFRVADLPGTVSYTWQLPADWIITAGQGTHAIWVTAGTTAGKVSVKAQNACDGSAAGELEVQPRPVVPLSLGAIAGSSMVCSGQRGLEYAIGPVSGAQTYTWSLPAGWVITSGQGTEKITVIAGQASGSVTVVAANSCVQTPAASLAIASMPAPGAPAIRDLSNTCDGLVYAAEDKTELNTRPPVAYTWTVPPGWIITNGQGTRKISVTAPAGSTRGLVAVTATNGNCPGEPVSLEADPALAEARISIANAITANGDGHNDNWDIANLQNYPDNEVVVLNRWGNEVYRKKAYANNWNGGQLNAGTYFYQLKVKVCDGSYKSYQGYVMVLR